MRKEQENSAHHRVRHPFIPIYTLLPPLSIFRLHVLQRVAIVALVLYL